MVDLSIIIPLHNEEHRLPLAMRKILKWLNSRNMSSEVILVENGSTDATRDICYTYHSSYPGLVRAYNIPARSKGRAVQFGMLEASGTWRYMADVDLATPIQTLDVFMFLREEADVIIASREAPGAQRIGEPHHRHLMGRLFNTLVQSLALPGIADSQCGFKLFSARSAEDIFSRVTSGGMAFDVEALYIARRFGYRILEIPVVWNADPDSRVRMVRDSLTMLREIWDIRHKATDGIYEPLGVIDQVIMTIDESQAIGDNGPLPAPF